MPYAMVEKSMGEPVELRTRGVRIVISAPAGEARLGVTGTIGIVRPYSTASWRARVERSVAAMAEQGETTLVLCAGGSAAKRLLPRLPDVCFVEAGDFTGAALRRAVEHGIAKVVFVGMAGRLTGLASGVPLTHCARGAGYAELLAEITTAMGGSASLAEQVAAAGTGRLAYDLWEAAGLLGRAGRELCRRAAGALEEFAAAAAPGGPGIAAQVVLVDSTGRRMIAMYGRLAR